jgi:hypothetical protein
VLSTTLLFVGTGTGAGVLSENVASGTLFDPLDEDPPEMLEPPDESLNAVGSDCELNPLKLADALGELTGDVGLSAAG